MSNALDANTCSTDVRRCGPCRLCTTVMKDIPEHDVGEDVDRRSFRYTCLWRSDHEGLATPAKARPDESGVLITQLHDTRWGDGLRVLFVLGGETARRNPWVEKLIDRANDAVWFILEMAIVGTPQTAEQMLPKRTQAYSRSGVVEFLKHKSNKKGGI